jgi:hypothetical protein
MALPPNYAYRADAAESAFVERALLYVETEVYNTLYPPMEGMKYVPVDTSSPEGALTTSYRQYTRTGIAKLVTGRGQDLPTSRVFVKEFFHRFYPLGMSYEYTLDDLLAAQMSSQNGGPSLNIDMELAKAAREGIDRGLDAIAGIGSATSATIPGLSVGVGADVGMLGLLNQTNASTYTPATGAAGSTLWSAKTPDEVIADLTGQYAAMVSSTYKVFKPTTYLLPINEFEEQNGRRMGDGSDETVISFFKKIKPGVEVDSWQYCEGAGSGGTNRVVAYQKDKRVIRHMVSQMFRQMPPQFQDFTFKVPCRAKTAGCVSSYPIGISYMDNI